MIRGSLTVEARKALQSLQNEVAIETGRPIKNNDFGEMSSYQCGYMVKKMIEYQEKEMIDSIRS